MNILIKYFEWRLKVTKEKMERVYDKNTLNYSRAHNKLEEDIARANYNHRFRTEELNRKFNDRYLPLYTKQRRIEEILGALVRKSSDRG